MVAVLSWPYSARGHTSATPAQATSTYTKPAATDRVDTLAVPSYATTTEGGGADRQASQLQAAIEGRVAA